MLMTGKEQAQLQVLPSHEYNQYYLFKTMRQENKSSLERQLLTIIEARRMSRGEYFERVTPEYELALEYDAPTILISLNTVGGKHFRQIVCDEGQYQLRNGLRAQDIFYTIKQQSDFCQVDHHRGVLIIKIISRVGNRRESIQRKQIKLKQKELCAAARQKIEFGRVARKCLKFIRGETENLKKKYEEQYRKQLMLMEEEQKRILRKQEKKFTKEMEEFKKKNYRPENLVIRTCEVRIRIGTQALTKKNSWRGSEEVAG